MLKMDYSEDFCIAMDFSPEFVVRLMEAGFLVMSAYIHSDGKEPLYILLPKLHLVRSALFFENLHIKKSIRRYIKHYELRYDVEFDHILDCCIKKHGSDWLTPPLIDCIKKIRDLSLYNPNQHQTARKAITAKLPGVRPVSFALYRDGKLTAGEFGIVCGRVYTSYSGYYDEDNAGTVQLILTTKYLQENGFSFFDLGMPMDYKTDLGALDINPNEFVRLFRG
jgi:Leu/Phe-tRNA-protein transferase